MRPPLNSSVIFDLGCHYFPLHQGCPSSHYNFIQMKPNPNLYFLFLLNIVSIVHGQWKVVLGGFGEFLGFVGGGGGDGF